jgi:hypothetical protein
MIRLSRTLPEGWTLRMPDPASSLPEIARASNGPITVHIRWPVPSDTSKSDPSQFRAIARPDQPSPEDWILSATKGNQSIGLPEEIREWAAREVQQLYTAFKDLE